MSQQTPMQFEVLVHQPPTLRVGRRRILVLKLDHLGDFIISLPALERLRHIFSGDHITLVVGRWNLDLAQQTGLADEVRVFAFFPENIEGWDGQPVEDLTRFREVTGTGYDLAIDLRIFEDTRHLLQIVDARVRCGCGSRVRFPFLDIALPDESMPGMKHSDKTGHWSFVASDFQSRTPALTPFLIETDFSLRETHWIWGPYVEFPQGRYCATIGLEPQGLGSQVLSSSVVLDIAATTPDGKIAVLASKTLAQAGREELVSGQVRVDFMIPAGSSRAEFRIYLREPLFDGKLRFTGVRVDELMDADSGASRIPPSQLHSGEAISLLVQLVAERLHPVQPSCLQILSGGTKSENTLRALAMAGAEPPIYLAPFSNSSLRDWPVEHYAALIRLLLQNVQGPIALLGSQAQGLRLNALIERVGSSPRVIKLDGKISWKELPGMLASARLLIGNNSGVAHLAAAVGAPVLAIYSGSHEVQKWAPRGAHSRAISSRTPCAPCHLNHLRECGFAHRCMTAIAPETVLEHAIDLMALPTQAACLSMSGKAAAEDSGASFGSDRPKYGQ